MRYTLALFSFLYLLLSSPLLAKSWQDFCSEVPNWPKGSDVPNDLEYQPLATPINGAFAKEKWDTMMGKTSAEKWIIVDARSEEDRAPGKIARTAMITADYKDPNKNEFKENIVVERINKVLKTAYKNVKDMNEVRFIVFCNGRKCHRSTFGACKLRDMGIPRENVYVMLGGFPEWKDAGYPTK